MNVLLTDPSGGGLILSQSTDGPSSSRYLPNNSLKPFIFFNASYKANKKSSILKVSNILRIVLKDYGKPAVYMAFCKNPLTGRDEIFLHHHAEFFG